MSAECRISETVPVASPKGQPAGPCLMVIFGASGDLTRRKLIPALYNLARSQYLPENFAVVGFAVDSMSTEQFRETISTAARELDEAPIEPDSWGAFVERLYYMQGDFGDPSAFGRLRVLIEEVSLRHNTEGNCLYYLATSPAFFSTVIEQRGGLRWSTTTTDIGVVWGVEGACCLYSFPYWACLAYAFFLPPSRKGGYRQLPWLWR